MDNVNENFARPKEDGTPEYGPNALKLEDGRTIFAPKAEHYALFGYLPLKDEEPVDPPEGKRYERLTTIESDGAGYRWQYKLVDTPPAPPPLPRRWTRFAIKGALADAHLLPAVKLFLATYELKPDYPALEAFTDVNYIEEGYGGEEQWNALLNGAAMALGKTREDVDAFLDSIPVEVY